jgi:hypothetical protein
MLSPEQCIGSVDVSLLPSRRAAIEEEKRIALAQEQLPLVAVVNLHDFEVSISTMRVGIPRQNDRAGRSQQDSVRDGVGVLFECSRRGCQ